VSRTVIVDEVPALAGALAERLARDAGAAGSTGRGFSILLTGGSIATALFPRLARAPLDWARVSFWWADERAVPPQHPESNYRLAHELWLAPARVPEANVHRMPAGAADLDAAAADYARELAALAGDPPRIDWALLGLGEDGHVASLFPGHLLLLEERRTVAAVADSPKPPPRRLTVTMPVLASAALVVVGAFGSAKAAAIAEGLGDAASLSPVALLLRRAARLLVLLDPPAAAKLARGAHGVESPSAARP